MGNALSATEEVIFAIGSVSTSSRSVTMEGARDALSSQRAQQLPFTTKHHEGAATMGNKFMKY